MNLFKQPGMINYIKVKKTYEVFKLVFFFKKRDSM